MTLLLACSSRKCNTRIATMKTRMQVSPWLLLSVYNSVFILYPRSELLTTTDLLYDPVVLRTLYRCPNEMIQLTDV